jgi:zinc protease
MPLKKANTFDGFSFIKESGGIEEYKLDQNGLTVLTLEDYTAPVVTFMVTYHVGSRNEAIGNTGSTHLLT